MIMATIYRVPDTAGTATYGASMLESLLRALISIGAMLAVLIALDSSGSCISLQGRTSASTVTRGGDRRRTRPRLAQVTSTSRDITSRFRSASTLVRSRISG